MCGGLPFLFKSLGVFWKVEDEFAGFGECPITEVAGGRGEGRAEMAGATRLLSAGATKTRERGYLPGRHKTRGIRRGPAD